MVGGGMSMWHRRFLWPVIAVLYSRDERDGKNG
jgi:hypothetical protein